MPSPLANDDLDFLLRRSVEEILKTEDHTAFSVWFNRYAEAVSPNFFAQLVAEARPSFKGFFSRFIWNRTALPGNHFRPRPIPKPERNAPCPCGSGKKYKHCCLREETLHDQFPNMSLLSYVLDTLTAKQRAALPYEYLPPEELEHVAREWMKEGGAQDAAKLLEGLFADIDQRDERAAERAKFWVARLARDKDFSHRPLIEFLRGGGAGRSFGRHDRSGEELRLVRRGDAVAHRAPAAAGMPLPARTGGG